jgi:putative transposase
MPRYHRIPVAGAAYIFTVNLADRSARTLAEHIDLLPSAYAAPAQR